MLCCLLILSDVNPQKDNILFLCGKLCNLWAMDLARWHVNWTCQGSGMSSCSLQVGHHSAKKSTTTSLSPASRMATSSSARELQDFTILEQCWLFIVLRSNVFDFFSFWYTVWHNINCHEKLTFFKISFSFNHIITFLYVLGSALNIFWIFTFSQQTYKDAREVATFWKSILPKKS